MYGKRQYGLLSTVLGWLPNFLAAFGMLALAMLLVQLLQGREAQFRAARPVKLVLLGMSIFVTAGLLWHEFGQEHSGLFYDLNDVYATLVGTAAGALVYYYALIRHPTAPA